MSKSKAQGAKGKRKNNGPAELRYKAELRWVSNKKKRIARDQREKARHEAKHARRGTLGYRGRRLHRVLLNREAA